MDDLNKRLPFIMDKIWIKNELFTRRKVGWSVFWQIEENAFQSSFKLNTENIILASLSNSTLLERSTNGTSKKFESG